MMKLQKKFINEVLGVPSNIENVSKRLFNFFSKKIEEEGQNIIDPDENYEFEFQGRFKIADFNFNTINLNLGFIETENVDEITIINMALGIQAGLDPISLKLISRKTKGINLSVRFALPISKQTKFSELLDFVQIEELELQSSFSHELMHAFEDYKKPYETPEGRAKYSALQNVSFGIPPLNEFVYYLYFASATENTVRPSEVNSIMKKGDIRKDMFVDFLLSNRTYKMYKEINNFSLNNFRNEMLNFIPRINEILSMSNEQDNFENDIDKVDRILELYYINLSNKMIEQYKNLLTTDFHEMFIGFSGDKQKLYNDFINETQRFKNNPLKFFEYQEKKIRNVSNYMLKKLSKLYALIEDKKSIKNWDLHTKINKKTQIESKYRY